MREVGIVSDFVDICDHGDRVSECPLCRPTDPALGPLLDDVEAFLRRFLVMSDDAFAIVAVWVAHVFAFAAFEFTPYLSITSATKRSGKSRLLELLEVIFGPLRSVSTANISAASLFRLIDANHGLAVLFDEIDRIPKEKAEEFYGLINSGWRLGGKAHRQTGQKMEHLQAFSTFSPKVLAGIGQPLPDSTADRCLPIRMERKLKSETVERLRLRRATAEAAPLREAFMEWANKATLARLQHAEPAFPTSMTNDRLMDVSEPLFAICDMAGSDWPARIRQAVVDTEATAEQIEEEELGILALRHVAETFAEQQVEKLFTHDLLAYMVRRDDAPWAEWWGDKVDAGKTAAPAQRLGKLLKRFGIHPKQVRIGADTKKGYDLGPILGAAERYLRPLAETTETTETPLASTVSPVSPVSATHPNGEGPNPFEALVIALETLGEPGP
jgi:hypothetical protein